MNLRGPVAYIRRSVARAGDPGDISDEFQTDKVRSLANGDGPTLRYVKTGAKAVYKVFAKTGRRYVGCPDCQSFARDRPPLAAPDEPDAFSRLLDAIYGPPPSTYDDDLPF